jgi:hypothetical protein
MSQNPRPIMQHRPGWRQRGVTVLVIVALLAFLVGIIAAIVTRSGVQESAIAGNDLRAREAHEAAQAGLEYALAWAGRNPVKRSMSCPGDAACPVLAPVTGTSSGESYALALQFTLGPAGQVRVRSTASNADNGRARVEAWIRQVSLLRNDSAFPPPFVINGSLDIVLGNPVIDTGNPPATALVTSGPVTDISTGHFNKSGTPPLGATVQAAFLATATPAWDQVFKVPLQQAISTAQAAASTYPATPSSATPFYYWNTSAHITGNYGSADRPVVIIIPAPYCPNINGGVVIYGMVYFSQTCSDQGWGNADIYGSVISEGDIHKLNANTVFHGMGTAEGWDGGGTWIFLDHAAMMPGTWKDF